MAMLAEPRRKQKWTLNPRGKQWSDDSNKFGQKMLEKFGWTSGKGLGANEQGMVEHVRVKFKDDSGGIGYSKDDQDNNWTEHQESFNELLARLASADESTSTSVKIEPKDTDLSGVSLEQKSKQSRARVHYRKFTRGKDVNKYSAKDLANIFGKKDLSDPVIKKKAIKEEEAEESVIAPIGAEDKTGGVLTYKGGNMADYFKNKLGGFTGLLKKPSDDDEDDDDKRYVGFGFGFSSSTNDLENNKIDSKSFDNKIESPKKKKIKKNKNISEGFVNDALDVEIKFENKIDTPISCDNFEVKRLNNGLENNGLDLTDETVDKKHVISNNNFELTSESLKKKKTKRKLDKIEAEGFVNSALDLDTKIDCKTETPLSCNNFEVSRSNLGLENNALDLTDEKNGKRRVTFNDKLEFNTDSSKKKKKTKAKLDKFEVDNEKLKKKEKKKKKKNKEQDVIVVEDNVFFNEALDVEIVNEEVNDNEANEKKSKKSKRKRDRRLSNLETIEETPEEESSQNSNDKDNLEPPKKKKKNNTTETIDVNEKSSSQIVKQDDNDVIEIINLEEETKKKNKKKNKKTDDVEIMEIENNNEVLKIDCKENNEDTTVPDKKKSKKNKKNKSKNQQVNNEQINKENNEEKQTKIDEIKNTEAKIPNKNISTTIEDPTTRKKLKKSFTKIPVFNFNGSNINDIVGYGN